MSTHAVKLCAAIFLSLVTTYSHVASAACTSPTGGTMVEEMEIYPPHYAFRLPTGEFYFKGQLGAKTPLARSQMFLDFVEALSREPDVWVVRSGELHTFHLLFQEMHGCRTVIVSFRRP